MAPMMMAKFLPGMNNWWDSCSKWGKSKLNYTIEVAYGENT